MRLHLILILGLALSCRTAPQRSGEELAHLERVLSLKASPSRSAVRAGETLDIRLELTNTSRLELTVCLGIPQGTTWWGVEQKYVEATPHWITDHPGCEEKLWLPAHGSYEWSQSVTVPEVPPGSARVHVSVQVIGLKNCDRYGCDSVNVKTSFSPVAIVPPSN